MATNEVVKRNISGMQVIKTLLLLLKDNYTMAELISKLNENEKEPIFNNSVISKYINTCRYCVIEIHKIHNKYFVAKLPFGLIFTEKDLDLIKIIQKIAIESFTNRTLKLFNNFITRLNKFSNKDIIRIEKKTIDLAFEHFEKAIQENKRIKLMLKTKTIIECKPIDIINLNDKKRFKILVNDSEKIVSVDSVSALEILGKAFNTEEQAGQTVVFKLTGNLASRYTLREQEKLTEHHLPEYIVVSNVGENKNELISRLLRYDKNCEILRPQVYREEMKTELKAMLANYGEQ